jgi:hypothetical protein
MENLEEARMAIFRSLLYMGIVAIGVIPPVAAATSDIAFVTNVDGIVTRVVNLQAVYHPGGFWIGPEPTSSSTPRLLAILEHQDGTTESLEFPFSEISELRIEKRPGPLGPSGAWFELIDIRRRDRSTVILGFGGRLPLRFEARDANGRVTRALSLKSWVLSTGLVGGRHNVLQRLEGYEILSNGTRRSFRIDWPNLKAIRFE